MAKIILDQGLTTQKQLAIDAYFEHPMASELNANKTYNFDELPDIPSDITTNSYFTTIEIISDSGVQLPVICTYNKITEFNINCYDEENPTYSYSIGFGYVTE